MQIGEERCWLDVRPFFLLERIADQRASGEKSSHGPGRALTPSITRIIKREFIGQICDQQVG